MPKRIGWKVLVGELPTPFHVPVDPLSERIKAHMKDGWICKGNTTRTHPSSLIWTQIVVKYASS